MRWKDREKTGSLGWLSWTIVNKHIDYLITSPQDAGWSGNGNTGKICDMLQSGIVPDFQGGGGSNDAMVNAIAKLSKKDSGYTHLFESLTESQRLCLFSAVLAEGRKDARGVAPSNAVIVSGLANYAAELGFQRRHFKMTEATFKSHLASAKSRYVHALALAVESSNE